MTAPRLDVDAAVIGAGVLGLAIAARLAGAGARVRILEQAATFGTGISDRSSGVIHAGIYYDPASLKGRLCVRGKDLLYAHCAAHSVRHRRMGKLFVALDPAHLCRLDELAERAASNGVSDLRALDRAEVRRLEPALEVEAALLSPSTGLVDARALMASLLASAERSGAVLETSARVDRADPEGEGWRLAAGERRVRAGLVVNAAGVDSIALARSVFGERRSLPTLYPAPGTYWRLSSAIAAPLSRMVCPATAPGLPQEIVVAVPTPDGGLMFGPTSLEERAVLDRIGEYLPDLVRAREAPLLVRGPQGVRPRLFAPGTPPADFHIDWAPGSPPWLDLFGIESPGLTACLAIAELVEQRLRERSIG